MVATGLLPSRGPARYSSTFWALTYPHPEGVLGSREGPGDVLAPAGSMGSARQTALCSPNPYQTKVGVCKADASAGGLRVGCGRASRRNALLGCDHSQVRPQDFALVHLMLTGDEHDAQKPVNHVEETLHVSRPDPVCYVSL